jgi:hypothetical protein
MKRTMIASGFTFSMVFLLVCGARPQRVRPSATYRAWQERAAREEKAILSIGCTLYPGESFFDGGKACKGWLITEEANHSVTSQENWIGFSKQIPRFPRPENVVRIELTKTADTNTWVVTLIDVDGKRMGYWLDSGDAAGGNVDDIFPY